MIRQKKKGKGRHGVSSRALDEPEWGGGTNIGYGLKSGHARKRGEKKGERGKDGLGEPSLRSEKKKKGEGRAVAIRQNRPA